MTELQKLLTDEVNRLGELLNKKNTDYGAAAFQTPLLAATNAKTAILVRMSDKIKRLEHLKNNKPEVDETFNETVRDLAGYCVLYLVNDALHKT